MKFIAKTSLLFAPASRQINFAAVPNFDVRGLLAVMNMTSNTLIYGTGVSGLGINAGSTSGNVVTLQFDTTAMSAGDLLMVWYEDGLGNGSDATGITPPSGGLGIQGYLSALYGLSAGKGPLTDYPGGLVRAPIVEDLLRDIVAQLQTLNFQIQTGLNLVDEPSVLSADFRNNPPN